MAAETHAPPALTKKKFIGPHHRPARIAMPAPGELGFRTARPKTATILHPSTETGEGHRRAIEQKGEGGEVWERRTCKAEGRARSVRRGAPEVLPCVAVGPKVHPKGRRRLALLLNVSACAVAPFSALPLSDDAE